MMLGARVTPIAIQFYRNTLKTIPSLHKGAYSFGRRLTTLAEKLARFETMSDDPLSSRLVTLAGAYEPESVGFVKKLVKPGMTVIDAGANIGYYTRLFARLVGTSGRVVAFEPHPRVFACLSRNAGSLNNVVLVQAGVGDTAREVVLCDYLAESAQSSMAYDADRRLQVYSLLSGRESAPRAIRDLPRSDYRVKMVPIDSQLQALAVTTVDFVKLDIEGAELRALKGMSETLARSGAVSMIVEFNPTALRAYGSDPLELWSYLRQCGFRTRRIKERGGLEPLESEDSVGALVLELMPTGTRAYSSVNLLCEKLSRPV